ncbi:M56 family peptidase [uncultured Mucilaginibacter sp.]|uniref:M56 family peptidase n=1 Tax=uncultured Mucilaginibacter sp. TaxID=797541 RepID=UPI0025EBDFF0|nr:M56 family peptidase [uncultured Mucilaginibacter sp.]
MFWVGAALLAMRLLMQLFSLYKMYRKSTPANIHNHQVRVIDGDSGPFSFWKSIFINPANHPPGDIKAILLHEQVHVNEWHTLDILLAELSTIFYWFNPGVWLMKRAVRENIEFITDRKILRNGIDSRQYQYSLLNVIFPTSPQGLVNHFNLSTIKKRIIMMNAKRSSAINLSRYMLLVPAVIALLLVFTVSKAELNSVKKGGVKMLNALKLEVSKMSMNASPVHKDAPLLNAVSGYSIQPDTSHQALLTLIDTVKKNQPDLPLYINGVKADQKGLANINPEDIAKMIVYRDSKAKTDDPEKAGYISVVTKGNENSEAVTALNEKMRKQFGVMVLNTLNNSVWAVGKPIGVTSVKVNGMTIQPLTLNVNTSELSDITVSGKKIINVRINGDTVWRTGAPGSLDYMIKSDSLYGIKRVFVDGHTIRVTQHNRDSLVRAMSRLIVKADGTILRTDSLLAAKRGLTVNADGSVTRIDTVYGLGVVGVKDNRPVYGLTKTLHRASPLTGLSVNKVYTFPRNSLSAGPINFTDKLIIIDGKEATPKQLKKLSLQQIQSIDNLSGQPAKVQYGDKGKNGVLIITTKK